MKKLKSKTKQRTPDLTEKYGWKTTETRNLQWIDSNYRVDSAEAEAGNPPVFISWHIREVFTSLQAMWTQVKGFLLWFPRVSVHWLRVPDYSPTNNRSVSPSLRSCCDVRLSRKCPVPPTTVLLPISIFSQPKSYDKAQKTRDRKWRHRGWQRAFREALPEQGGEKRKSWGCRAQSDRNSKGMGRGRGKQL